MKKKYYYDCPIQALYMNEEFGVDFLHWVYPSIHKTEMELLPVGISYLENIIPYFNHKYAFENRFIVAPKSEHIFEPKEGDLCKNIEDDDMGELCMIQGHGLAIPVANGGEGGWMVVDKSEVEILKRDNKQFFNPKEEN